MSESPTITILDPESGNPWTIRLVRTWDYYGRGQHIQNTAEAMVEFYDAEFADNPFFIEENAGNAWGQFVARYYLSTMLSGVGGLSLYLDIPKWSLSQSAMQEVRSWIKEQC